MPIIMSLIIAIVRKMIAIPIVIAMISCNWINHPGLRTSVISISPLLPVSFNGNTWLTISHVSIIADGRIIETRFIISFLSV